MWTDTDPSLRSTRTAFSAHIPTETDSPMNSDSVSFDRLILPLLILLKHQAHDKTTERSGQDDTVGSMTG